MRDTVCVPRVIEYDDNEPLGVNGEVVAVIKAGSRRITVLVREPAANHVQQSESETSEGVTLPDDYRDLQELAGDYEDVDGRQSEDDLRADLQEKMKQ